MRIYLAGTSVSKPDQEPVLQNLFKCSHKLHSFYHVINALEKEWFNMNKANQVELFIDSGAFSAWTQGADIDIDEYCDFVLQHIDIINAVASLDVIPGSWGKTPTKKQAEESARQGWKNYRYMLKRGVPQDKLVHIFHQGEDFKWLRRMTKLPYIGLSPANDKTTEQKSQWLDECMRYVVDENGMPVNKWHGFGLTSLKLMLRYPWYSVDSTSWVTTGRMGSIYVPRYRDGQWIYDENSWKVAVSSRSPAVREAGKHINNFPPKQKEVIEHYIHNKGYKLGRSTFKRVDQNHTPQEGERWAEKKAEVKNGKRLLEVIEEEGLCNRYQLRDEINIIYFLDLEQSIPEWPWPFKLRANKGLGLRL